MNGFDDLYLNIHVHIRWVGLDKWNINLMKHVHCTYKMSLSRGWWDLSYVTVSLSLFCHTLTSVCVCVCFLSDLCPLYDYHYATYTQSLESIVGRLVHRCNMVFYTSPAKCSILCSGVLENLNTLFRRNKLSTWFLR